MFYVELSLIKKLIKWADGWIEMANILLETQPSIKIKDLIHQSAFFQELNLKNYSFSFDPKTLRIKVDIVPANSKQNPTTTISNTLSL